MVYKVHGTPKFQLRNTAETFSLSNIVLSQRQRQKIFRSRFPIEWQWPFSPMENRRPSSADSNGDKILQLSEQSNPRVIKILMVLWRGETDAERGFLTGLRAMGYRLMPTVINVDRSLKRLRQILHFEINCEDYDYIYTSGTRVTLVVNEYVRNRVPIIFNDVGYPTEVGLANEERNRVSGGNFSGVGTAASMSMQLENMQKILKVKRLAVLVNSKENFCLDTWNTWNMVAKTAPLLGIAVECFDATDRKEICSALEKIKSVHFDAIYVPFGSPFTENSEIIFDFGRMEKVAIVVEEENMVRDGALMGTVAGCEESGKLAAQILHMHSRYQIAMCHIPIQCSKFHCIVNWEVVKALGICPNLKKINGQWFPRGLCPLELPQGVTDSLTGLAGPPRRSRGGL
jgi:ABC-type uncharacterized transport system substrate-binding protein